MAKSKLYRYPIYLLVRGIAAVLAMLPRSCLLALARALGWLAYYVLVHHRNSMLSNLKCAFPGEKKTDELRCIAVGVFQHLAQTASDVLLFPRSSREILARYVDCAKAFRVIDELLKEGKGLILLTSHMGNWELLGGMVLLNGYLGKPIARRLRYEPFQKWIEDLRKSVKVEVIYRDESPKKMISLLHQNGILGVLPDQDIDSVKGVFVNFFGRPAYTSVAPVKLALSTQAPILTCFMVRRPGDRYEMVVGDVIRPRIKSGREEAILEYTQAWTSSCESVIRQYPDQWAWIHNRWKTASRPEISSNQKSS